jgi:hypothetical protein
VRNDRKSPPARNLVGEGADQLAFVVCGDMMLSLASSLADQNGLFSFTADRMTFL